MPEYTTKFNLPKPLPNENVSREAHNSLVDAIDSQIGRVIAAHEGDFVAHKAESAAHNATSAATASRLIVRDANGRAQVASPSAAADIVRKDYVDNANATKMPLAGGTFTGIVVAQNNTSYGTKQIRNIVLSTADPSGGGNGDIWFKYTP